MKTRLKLKDNVLTPYEESILDIDSTGYFICNIQKETTQYITIDTKIGELNIGKGSLLDREDLD